MYYLDRLAVMVEGELVLFNTGNLLQLLSYIDIRVI